MDYIVSFLIGILGCIMRGCYRVLGSYGLSIIVFTFITKLILLPINLFIQKNSIKMVKMQPELDALKIKYIDDKDKFTDEQLALYKKHKYNPFISTVPLLVQVLVVLGLVGVIYRPLSYMIGIDEATINSLVDFFKLSTEDGRYQIEIFRRIAEGQAVPQTVSPAVTEAIRSFSMEFMGFDLSLTPSLKTGGIELLVPFLAGLSAFALCFAQNKINVLQTAQGSANKIATTVFMVAFSLYFAFLVPAGVGLYWIFGNLFAIPMMFVVNTIIPPKKYIDYEYLKKMREQKKLKEAEQRKYSKRERADYKRFFAVENMQLMFYSEQNGFYKYYAGMIDYICNNSDIQIHYVTSDPNDKIFQDKREQIHPYFVASDKYLIPLFMKLDCDMCVMTMPDLEKYHIKRSRVRKDIEYVYVCHGTDSKTLTLRKGALDWFDTVFCQGIDAISEIREMEKFYGTKTKRLVEVGYPLIDELLKKYKNSEYKTNNPPKILIAPSWQKDNIIDLCINEILDELSHTQYEIVLRPHPQHVRHQTEKFEQLKGKYAGRNITIQTDFTSDSPVLEADLLITDWSGIAFEYAYVTKRPVLFINTPMKVMNPDYTEFSTVPVNISLRNVIGRSLDTDKLGDINNVILYLLNNRESFAETITNTFHKYVFNIGKSASLGGIYIIKMLKARRNK